MRENSTQGVLKLVFAGGLAVPFAAVFFSSFALFVGVPNVTWFTQYTLIWALLHMLLLSFICWHLEPNQIPTGVDTLHRAGFLHTLISLGAAIARMGDLIHEKGELTGALTSVLIPMSASLLPHVWGVGVGHLLSTRYFAAGAAIEESVFGRLLEDADAARDIIRDLYKQRETSLQNQIRLLDEQRDALAKVTSESVSAMAAAVEAMKNLTETTGRANTEIASGLTNLANAMAGVGRSATDLRGQVQSTAEAAQACSNAFRDTCVVVKDVKSLHQAIVDLVHDRTFPRPIS